MLDCPVCAKPVDRGAAPTSVYQGVTYYFRCPRCKDRFDAEPQRYLRDGADGEHGGCGEGGGCAEHGHAHAPGRPLA